jgi:transcriptional regulator with XRE-family HTH domain
MSDDDLELVRNLPYIRRLRGLSQAEAAELAGVPRSSFCEWEKGQKTPEPASLARLRTGLRVSAAENTLLRALRSLAERGEITAVPRLKLHALQVGLETTALALAALERTGSFLPAEAPQPAAVDRKEAPELLARFLRLRPREREALLQASLAFRKWALCEALCLESRRRAPEAPVEAVELARWAVAVAERVSDTAWSLRLRGFATAALADAEDAAGETEGADASRREARELWDAGRDDWGLLGD